jgi:ubiquinone/menaquinone biosynthesis C-methylase UbiE
MPRRRNPMLIAIILVTAVLMPACIEAQDGAPRDLHEMQRLHSDPQAYIGMLEDPKRDVYQKPREVLTALDLRRGEIIADIGAGSGYFTFRIAHHVGSEGKVYAVDVNPDMIRHINRRIRELQTNNVISVLADPDDPLLPERSVNRFFMCDVWHHVENRTKYLALMKKMLKPGGEIVMIDFHKKPLPLGPPPQMKIAREEVIEQLERGGFRLAREHTFLPYQYFLVFVPK